MEGLALAVLVGVSGGLLYGKKVATDKRRAREGFQEIMNPGVAKVFNPAHNEFVQTGASRFNPIQNLMDPTNNVLLPSNFTQQDVNKKQTELRKAIGSVLANPNNPSFQVSRDPKKNILLNAGGKGTALGAIKSCEAIKTIDCNAFDQEDFAFSCGLCFQDGKTASGTPQVGGLYISEDDRASAEVVAKRMNSRTVNYKPSVGDCADSMFVTTKQQCLALQRKLKCQTDQSFGASSECSQCFQDQSFHYTASDLVKSSPMLVLTGSGKLAITKAGSSDVNISANLTEQPQQFEIENFLEGDVLEISVSPETASLAGYLLGITPSGDFRLDIIRLIQTDQVTGSKPRLAGVTQVGEDAYSLIKPGRGQTSMKLLLLNTFTFLEVSEQEAIDCGASPYITKESSATFLESSPCFKKGMRPGSYGLECLQQTFVGAGCTEQGEGYPSTQGKAQTLMTGPDGKFLTIGQIAQSVYEKSLLAYTGLKADGSKMDIKEWNKLTTFCTGKSITSPCDFDNKDAGPLSPECLSYLWKNTGAVENVAGNVGGTYTSSNKQASLDAINNDRFCTPQGLMAPIDANGKINEAAVAAARAKGGVKGVQEFYNQIHLKANDNSQVDNSREDAVKQCYGLDFAKLAEDKPNSKVSAITNKCIPEMVLDSVDEPNDLIQINKKLSIKGDWSISFTVNMKNKNLGSDYITILYLYSDDARSGVYFSFSWYSGKFGKFKIQNQYNGTGANLNKTADAGFEGIFVPLDVDVNVSLVYTNKVFTLEITDGQPNKMTKSVELPFWTGNLKLYVGNPNGRRSPFRLSNLSFSSCDDVKYPSVLDYKPGRTKSGLNAPPPRTYVPFEGVQYTNKIIKTDDNTKPMCEQVCEELPGCIGFEMPNTNLYPYARGCTYFSSFSGAKQNNDKITYRAVVEGGRNYEHPEDWKIYACPAIELGPFGMAPWGKQWEGIQRFPDDGTAKWIWVRRNAATNEPSWGTEPFLRKVQNDTGKTIRAILWVWADNVGLVAFNNVNLTNNFKSGKVIDFNIPPGENVIHINASNEGGPAGLIAICKDYVTGKTIFVTDGSWMTHTGTCARR